MSISTRALTYVGAAMFALSAMAGAALSQDKMKFVFGTSHPPHVGPGIAFDKKMKPLFDQHSNGRIAVDLHFSRAICAEQVCVEMMRLGQVDMGTISAANLGAFGRAVDFLTLPYLFENQMAALPAIEGWLNDEINKLTHSVMGVHVWGWAPVCGQRQLLQDVRNVKVPSDLKGIKLRVTKSPTEFTLISDWGAVAVPYDWAAVYQGIQSGVVNGLFLPDCHLWSEKFHEIIDFSTRVNGSWNLNLLVMDLKRYKELPDWARGAVDKTGIAITKEIFANDDAWLAESRKILESKGVVTFHVPNEEESKLWRKGAVGAWIQAKGQYDPALVKRILEAQGKMDFVKELQAAGAL